MKNLISFLIVLFLAVFCSACVNTFAVQELNQLAQKYMEQGDVNNAISRLESSVDLDGNIYESRYNLAVAYLKNNECDNALKNIEHAIKIDSKKPDSYFTLGAVYDCHANMYCETPFDDMQNQGDNNNKKDIKLCVESVNNALNSYNKYLELAPDAPDVEDVKQQIEENKSYLQTINAGN